MTTEALEAARTGNWFLEHPLAICRSDKLSRDGDVQAKLDQTDWDLIVMDEGHKLLAPYFAGEVKASASLEVMRVGKCWARGSMDG